MRSGAFAEAIHIRGAVPTGGIKHATGQTYDQSEEALTGSGPWNESSPKSHPTRDTWLRLHGFSPANYVGDGFNASPTSCSGLDTKFRHKETHRK